MGNRKRASVVRLERLEGRVLLSLTVTGYDPATSLQPLLNALVVSGTGISVNSGASTYVGSNAQGGTFSGLTAGSGANALRLPDGIILTSGLANYALPGAGISQAWNTAGDSNLTTLAGMSTHDANSITISFTTAPGTQSISFDFVYGSFDFTLDGFGAFLDGTSITANASGHAISRDPSFVTPNPYSSTFAYDQSTVRLRTTAPLDLNITTHTLKLVAADCGDDIVDSGVFLADLRGSTNSVSAAATAPAPTVGTFQADQAIVSTDTTSPQVTLTVDRVDGSSGPATVDYTTTDDTALAGTDFTLTRGTLSFADGQTSATVSIPLLDNALAPASSDFNFTLSNPTGGALLGTSLTTDVTITNSLSVVNFDAGQYSVAETDPGVTITVLRSGNLAGTGAVQYATADGTALDGINYTGVSGELNFAAGQSSASFLVPVKQDMKVDPVLDFNVALSNPSGSLRLGMAADSTVNVSDVTPPPTVSAVSLTPADRRRTSAGTVASTLSIEFDQTLADTPAAADITLYRRFNDRAGGKGGRRRVAVAVKSYDASTDTLTLKPGRVLQANRFYQLLVAGNAAQGESGALLDGANTGVAGSSFSYTFGSGKHLTYVDRDGNRVTLMLHGPGRMSLTRTSNGQGQDLTLVNVTSASVLTGSVHATRMGGSGATTLARSQHSTGTPRAFGR